MTELKTKLLAILSENARYTFEEIAVMLGAAPEQVSAAAAELEADGIIRGYKALIDWASVDDRHITAIIELTVTPQADAGFEEIAERISEFEYVEAVYLMSGGYDLSVIVTGQTFQKVAMFVSKHLATMKEVTSTGTHFVLRRYKDMGVKMCDHHDDRGTVSF